MQKRSCFGVSLKRKLCKNSIISLSLEIIFVFFSYKIRGVRVISDAYYQASRITFFNSLQELPFYEEGKIAKCCVAYKRIKGRVPLYIEDYLGINSQQHSCVTRCSNINFICPKSNRLTEVVKTFVAATCQLWNGLSLDLRNALSLVSFFKEKQELHHFIVQSYFVYISLAISLAFILIYMNAELLYLLSFIYFVL